MKTEMDRMLIRWLAGEATPEEAEQCQRAIDGDESVRRRWETLEATWSRIDPPPSAEPPLGFAQRVRAVAEAERSGSIWGPSPVLGRWAAGTAMALGIGVGLGVGATAAPAGPPATVEDDWLGPDTASTFAEAYWDVVASDDLESESSS